MIMASDGAGGMMAEKRCPTLIPGTWEHSSCMAERIWQTGLRSGILTHREIILHYLGGPRLNK